MVTSLDDAVGRIRAKLNESKLADNTMIIFTSDNGAPLYFPAGSNQPLYGGKMSCFEGGLRVPLLVHWQGRLAPTTFDPKVSLIDVFKTVAATVGKVVPDSVARDGVNLLPYVSAQADTLLSPPHEALYWRVGYAKAIQLGDWKLDWNEKEGFTNLHNLALDSAEWHNIAAQHPEKVAKLKNAFADWEQQLTPTRWNPSLDAKIEDGRGLRFYFPW
jgi:uncharacterized sulfatase